MSKGLPEARTDAAMSELVPEPRPKPAVPMKPVSIHSNLLGYIGIDTIIEQMRKKTMKTGFDFNIMVVGQSGLGKSTLVNTLFKSQVSRKASSWNREEKIPKTVEIKAIGHGEDQAGTPVATVQKALCQRGRDGPTGGMRQMKSNLKTEENGVEPTLWSRKDRGD